MASASKILSPPLALTMGDPSGIGPDITLRAWSLRETSCIPPFILAGDPDVYSSRAEALGLDVPVEVVTEPRAALSCFARALPVFPLLLPHAAKPGAPDPAFARTIIQSIDIAFDWVRQGAAAAMVTNPIAKKLLTEAGFAHPGHTEYLAELCAQSGAAPRPVMLLASGELRVVPATIHVPLRAVPKALTEKLLVETVEITVEGLQQLFRIPAPRVAMTGLNPHAGEEGTLGREEIEVISPAIEKLKAKGVDVQGPLAADAAFQERNRQLYDVIIAMYHDQALIPAKTLAFDSTVNVTLGLPIVRTSPDHGTAYGIAGTGAANPGSLIESLKLARQLAVGQMALT